MAIMATAYQPIARPQHSLERPVWLSAQPISLEEKSCERAAYGKSEDKRKQSAAQAIDFDGLVHANCFPLHLVTDTVFRVTEAVLHYTCHFAFLAAPCR